MRIGLFTAEFEDRVAKQSVSTRIFWIELNGFAKFGYGAFREMADGVRATNEHVQSGGISNVVLQVLEPPLRVRGTFGFQIGNTKKVGSLKIVVQCDGGLQVGDGSGKVCAV